MSEVDAIDSMPALAPHTQITEVLHPFASMENFMGAWKMATILSQSTIIPVAYQGKNNIPNAVVAIELANRMKMSPLLVMQNLFVILGKPSWSAKFLIAMINSSGRFSPLRWKITKRGKKKFTANEIEWEDCTYIAWVRELATGDVLEGPEVTSDMVFKEGWYQKKDSKWQSMPDLMFRYRSASFFSNLYCPDIAMGLKTSEEYEDMEGLYEGTDIKRIEPTMTAKERAEEMSNFLKGGGKASSHKAAAQEKVMREELSTKVSIASPPDSEKQVAQTQNIVEPKDDTALSPSTEQNTLNPAKKQAEPEINAEQSAQLEEHRRILLELLGVFGLGLTDGECEAWVQKRFGGSGIDTLDMRQLSAAVMMARKAVESH